MMLIEQTTVPSAALPVAMFKDHLRVGTGFGDDGVQDNVLESHLRVAMAAIEARTGKVLITRSFLWSLTGWREPSLQGLPVAPVSAVLSVKTLDRLGEETIVDPALYRLRKDDHRPRLEPTGSALPNIPIGGGAEIEFEAGFDPSWSELPADLAHSVFLLAAHYYDHRNETGTRDGSMPFGVNTLIERYRTVRILGGGTK